ncbi:hypothetical protein BANRA_00024 [Escherichia coli]|nr:hypothetical protein BANRA_00024 [Escherichia coli]
MFESIFTHAAVANDFPLMRYSLISLYHMWRILGKTASLAPRFKHHAKAFAVLQIRLDLLTDSGEVTAM